MKVFLKVCAIVTGLILIGISAAVLCLPGPLSPWLGGPVGARIGQSLGATVTLESFRIVPSKLGIEICGLAIANPEGFEPETAVRVGRVLIQPHLATLFSGTAHIRRIKLEEAEVRLRVKTGLGTNLGHLRDQAQRVAEANKDGKVFVDRVDVAALIVRPPDAPAPIVLPAFEIKQLSGESPGSLSKTGATLLSALAAQAFQAAGIDDIPSVVPVPSSPASVSALLPRVDAK